VERVRTLRNEDKAAGDLPVTAWVFLVFIYFLGLCSVIAVFTVIPWQPDSGSPLELAVFIVLSATAGHLKIDLLPVRKNGGNNSAGAMSLGFSLIFATLLRFGPQGAVLAGLASTLSSCIRPLQPWYQILFNLSVNVIETTLASLVFLELNGGSLELHTFNIFLAATAACLTFFFLNTGVVATIIALCTGNNPVKIWRGTFLWTAPGYFIGASISTIASAAMGNKMLATLLCAVPVGVLTHLSYRSYKDNAEEMIKSKDELATLYLATIRSLALAIDAKDQYTHQHILRVQQYAVATAHALKIDGDELKAIETGALLHDIGKLGVPEYVLLKPGRLSDEEYAKIKEHPRIGADILDPVKFPWPVLPVVKYHHERWDGRGYPEGLSGEAIPRTARILAVADVYDALTSTRSYRSAWKHERAIAEIERSAGTHFDPEVVQAFLTIADEVRERIARTMTTSTETLSVTTNHADSPPTTERSAEAVRHIQRTSSELWALYEVSQTLSASMGLDDTLEILGRKLITIFPHSSCLFLLHGFEEGMAAPDVLYSRFAVGLNQSFFRKCRTSQNSVSLRVMMQRETYLGDFDTNDLIPTGEPLGWNEIGSALIVPIVYQGESLGTINLYHTDPDAFGPHEQHLLEMIALRAAMALYNGLMFERTQSHAITDPLTGLANVRSVTEWMEDRIQATSEEENRFALLYLDLDSFKPINDNFGHQKGDAVLRDLATRFRTLVREGDLVGRNGGDEFVVLLRDAGPREAEIMAQQMQNVVHQYDANLVHPRLGRLQIGVSIGVACYPANGKDMATLFSIADAAMYENKTERKLLQLVDLGRAENYRMAASNLSDQLAEQALVSTR
jgi:diguanylate cyclase (GGDEF)-like protein/putative nucleotidyltransferase with HDIG domain